MACRKLSQAIGEQIDGARERLDVMNPHLTGLRTVERILRPHGGA